MFGHRELYKAIATVSAQVHNCERMLIFLITKSGHELDPQLLGLTNKLKTKTEALQAALDAHALTPKKPRKQINA
jgi:hypothetical protein